MDRPGSGEPAIEHRPTASPWLHVAFLLLLSAGFEALFIRHGLNPLDEGWPLYAAMQLQHGGELYADVFFVFPPGHLLPAWIGRALDPPGVIGARVIYAGFNVALCVALYLLGRRLMPPTFALLGASLTAVAAVDSHPSHFLFGYRYLVWSVLALWCFSERLRTGDRRWMLAAGALSGVALVFRLTPAAAVAVGIAAGTLASDTRWRSWWADGSRFLLGFLGVIVPVVAWFAWGVGLEKLWLEVVVRPVAMTDMQSLPVPPLELPERWTRWTIRWSFIPVQFRLYAGLYIAYAAVLAVALVRSLRGRQRFGSPLLLAVVVWGGIYFTRAFGRADGAHLDSTVPATCLLIAHAVSLPFRRGLARADGRTRRAARTAAVGVMGLWIFLTATDLYLNERVRGIHPVESLDGATAVRKGHVFGGLDEIVDEVRARSEPGDVLLDLTASSLIHVLTGLRGPGGADVVMPGTFLAPEEERAFLARLEQSPPDLVIFPSRPFDRMATRHIRFWAPRVTSWVERRYEPARRVGPWLLLTPLDPRAGARARGARPEPPTP